ncbi:MAG: retroviral-like aspartic protease [Rikenellaceae bacterium]|nr:retroviral-like aspartic protease [Rikenellaceae bacterium]MCL2691809.1 retroviral-like aspartic protease [Rikenellaceae bacterium]
MASIFAVVMSGNLSFPLSYGLKRANLPLILVEIQDKSLCFLLDTGSNINMIDDAVYEHFKDAAEQVGEFTHFGIEGNSEQAITVKIPFLFEGCTFAPVFSVVNLGNAFSKVHEECGIPINGLLGNKFFIEHGWVLDFEKLELCWQ